jgi:hypothetical protein
MFVQVSIEQWLLEAWYTRRDAVQISQAVAGSDPDAARQFYVTETRYVGPNQGQDRYADAHTFEITTRPPRTNMSHEVQLDGWLGTTNDWAYYAHGAYPTQEAARQALLEAAGDCREVEEPGTDPDILEIFRVGKLEPWSAEACANWVFAGAQNDVSALSTDADIDALLQEYEEALNAEGGTLHMDAARRELERRREQLRDDASEDDGTMHPDVAPVQPRS